MGPFGLDPSWNHASLLALNYMHCPEKNINNQTNEGACNIAMCVTLEAW